MKSKRNFRKNTKKNKTRKKRGGGPNEDAELFAAVQKSETTAADINAILEKGADVNTSNNDGVTPLHYACSHGHTEVAMALVEKGADVNTSDDDGGTALHRACWKGNMELAMALVVRGADVDAKNKLNKTPLEIAKETIDKEKLREAAEEYEKNKDELFDAVQKSETTVDQINAILDKGADVKANNSEGEKPLHWTCAIGNVNVAIALVDRGADVNARDKYGDTPLHLACMNGHTEVALALVDRGADIDAKNANNKTPLEIAIATIDKEKLREAAVKYKEKNKPNNANEELFAAVKKEGTTDDQINAIIEKGADVNARDVYLNKPLFYACEKGNVELALTLIDYGADVDPLYGGEDPFEQFKKLENHNKEILRGRVEKYEEKKDELFAAVKKQGTTADQINAILDDGAYVNARDEERMTPLHQALANGNSDVARALINRGAHVHAVDIEGLTALHIAIYIHDFDTIFLLIDKGATIQAYDKMLTKELTPYDQKRILEAIEEVKKRPKNVNEELFAAVEEEKTTAADIFAILDKGANVNATNSEGDTPLHYACRSGHKEMAMALINNGADVNSRDKYNRTPLHRACIEAHMELAMALIDKGADVEAREESGKTPLHLVFFNGYVKLAMALVDRGADVNAKDKDNKTPLDLIHKPEKKKTLEEYIKPKRNFITTKKKWKIYLDDEHAQQFENLNGKYEVEFVDGTIYQGDWKDNNKYGQGKLTYPNGDKYEGIWENDKLKDGKVKKTYDNGDVYEGHWKDDNKNGKGKNTFANGDIYEGEFKDDMKHGKGKFTYAFGDVYEGDYVDDEEHGKGKLTEHEGNIYEGDWKHGNYNGNGKMTYKDGTIYEGGWKDGGRHGEGKLIYKGKKPIDVVFETDDENNEYLISGEGTFFKIKLKDNVEYQEFNGKIENSKGTGSGKRKYSNGDVYEGEFQDGLKYGKGKYTYASGGIYEGDWKDDVKDGKGKMIFDNGNIYEGDYKDGKRHGKGKLTIANGNVYEGDWKDDRRNGKGKETYASGNVYEGDWKDGWKHGKGKYTWDSGAMYEGDYQDDDRNGEGKMIYSDGRIYKGYWKDDKKNGYGVMKYETAKYDGMIPAGSTYNGYWKNNKMHTKGSELGKLTWAPNDKSEYPDRSTPCGLRSFEGQWNYNDPILPEGYDDSPMSLENWGSSYVWKKGDYVLLDTSKANAYQIHQKGKKMQKKLGPALDFMEKDYNTVSEEKGVPKINETYEETPQWIIGGLKSHSKEFLNHLLENEDEISTKYASLERILDKLSTSDYIRNEDTKRIIVICFYYVLGELKSIEEGVEKVHFEGVKHEPEFQLYYINTFIEDTISAYNGPNGMSCTQGIFERFFTVLESTLALAVAPGNESFLGKDEATIQERREKYEKILDLWGRNKPKMDDILASFESIPDKSSLKDKPQDEKIKIVINFIKSKYADAGQDISSAEDDFTKYLETIGVTREYLFTSDPDSIFGGKRKTRRRRKKRTTRRRKGK